MQRIVINGRFCGRPVTGVERYAGELVRAIDQLAADNSPLARDFDFVMAVPPGVDVPFGLRAIEVERTGRFDGYLWEQVSLPLFAGRDILLNLCSLGPVLARNSVTCVHDANVWLFPKNYSIAFICAYSILVPLVIRTSRLWTTVSGFSGRQLTRLRVANRLPDLLTPNGADHVVRWDSSRSEMRRSDLPARYVFALGSRSNNKNLQLVYALAEDLRRHGIAVVVAGGNNSKVFRDNDAGVGTANVRNLGRVSDHDLAFLYSNALCFLFPSLYEGFGLPPVEAMALSCPVVSSNTSAMPEVLGTGAILCDPNVAAEWIEAIVRLAGDQELREARVQAGLAHAQKYRWSETAATLLQALRSLKAGEATRGGSETLNAVSPPRHTVAK